MVTSILAAPTVAVARIKRRGSLGRFGWQSGGDLGMCCTVKTNSSNISGNGETLHLNQSTLLCAGAACISQPAMKKTVSWLFRFISHALGYTSIGTLDDRKTIACRFLRKTWPMMISSRNAWRLKEETMGGKQTG